MLHVETGYSMRKIRILHLAQSAGYGVTVYVESLIKGLDKNKFEQILLGSDYYNTEHFRNMVDKLITIRMDRNITRNDINTILQCRKIIKKEKPDIVYCHSAKAGIYGRLACFGTKHKVVYNPHGWAFNMKCSGMKKIFYKSIEIAFAVITNKIVTISDYERITTPSLIPRKKVQTILNGVNIESYKQILAASDLIRGEVGIPENSFVVGLVARISIQKGQDLFVDVARRVKEAIPNAFFVIVGDKSDNVPIEQMIASHNLQNDFLITGEVPDAIRYAALFDVAVLTSRWEGFGLVIPEYMIAKKPIVAFAVDAIPELIKHGETGVLVEKENTIEMADAIIDLYKRPQVINGLVKKAYQTAVERFTLERVVKEHEMVFEEIVN